ncbi:hypothetical protein AVEN_21451-1 [Araneus ventricosus]|uniref:Uncharacterized protein n=1 Tax=Araneus ventricosus TaxID=182803 RepID=A0A4Y2WTD3_ARAVE|nr:hypothetical protein AVEN_262428-1 [Araneus ventricosus]GBO39720.1 hypothetical protein AVEN_21451-1 [Araneus ventricosus]
MNTDFYSFLAQGQSFRVHRLLPSTHAHGESDEKKKRQAGVNKYRAQKIAFNTHARGDSGLVGDALMQTVSGLVGDALMQTVNPSTDLVQNFIRTYIHDDKTVYQILSI